MGKLNSTDAEVEDVARQALVYEFADNLPLGLDTKVEFGGANLSGGQRQRIAIARALIKKAALVIWDEATSALDGETETLINRSIRDSFCGRTLIVISHRLGSVRNFDKIIMLQDGEILAVGKHNELIEQVPEYVALWGDQHS